MRNKLPWSDCIGKGRVTLMDPESDTVREFWYYIRDLPWAIAATDDTYTFVSNKIPPAKRARAILDALHAQRHQKNRLGEDDFQSYNDRLTPTRTHAGHIARK